MRQDAGWYKQTDYLRGENKTLGHNQEHSLITEQATGHLESPFATVLVWLKTVILIKEAIKVAFFRIV